MVVRPDHCRRRCDSPDASARPRLACICVRAGLLLLGMMLQGCTVGPDYQPPEIRIASSYGVGESIGVAERDGRATSRPTTMSEQSGGVTQWWSLFNDPTLNSLIDEAIRSSLDLRLAEARVREARALRAMVSGRYYPSVDATASYAHQRLSQNAPPYNAFSIPEFPWEFNLYQAGFDAAWEIDIFGRVRRDVEAARANHQASIEERRNVLLTMLAETARNYAELRGFGRQLEIAQQNLAIQQQTVELTRNRVANGVAPELDLTRAQSQAATTASRIPGLRSQVDQALTRLATLLGTDATQIQSHFFPQDKLKAEQAGARLASPPLVPIGLPSDLLRRRPDIRRAERQLAASTARVGSAVADLFPRFSLNGAFSMQAADLGSLLDFKSRSYGIGPGMTWPIFQGGQLRAAIDVRSAQQQQALVQYRMTVINAIGEVRDAIVSFGNEQDRRAQLVDAVAADQKSVDMANQLYRQGLLDFLSVLDAQRSLFQSQDALAQSDRLVTTDLIALYKALGGGWEIELIPR